MSGALPIVGPEALDGIAALCARAISQPLTVAELRDTLFAPDQQSIVRFDPDVGVVATLRSDDQGFIRLIAVDPPLRRSGQGTALLRIAESDLDGVRSITVGTDAPYFLFPGVPITEIGLCTLLESHHYSREEANYNVDVLLDELPADPGTAHEPAPGDRDEVDQWAEVHWSNWRAEVLRAFDRGTLLISRDADGIAALCAYDVNRSGTLGPVAARPDLMGRGAGRPVLLSALHRMRARGYQRIEVLWVGPIVPYARVGGRIGSVFFVYRKRR